MTHRTGSGAVVNSDTVSDEDTAAWGALGELYHRYLTGSLLSLVTRRGSEDAAEVVFRMLRRQQLELFLPGLAKLGLDELPHAVACAQYHVLSNSLGGVGVGWIPESDTKSWVRYLPPRWIFDGTAVCGIPSAVSRAQMWGWHSNNGVLLNNPNLGFVCTMQTSDGQPGLTGYYVVEDRALAPEERLRFSPGERPPGRPVELAAPSWDPLRLAKVERNYSMAYVRSLLPAVLRVLGPAEGAFIGRLAGKQIGMQFHSAVMDRLGTPEENFAQRFARLLRGHGDSVTVTTAGGDTFVHQSGWRLLRGTSIPLGAFEAWNGLWEGMADMEDQRLDVVEREDLGDPCFTWRLRAL